ncbi:hypothetical protein TcWFU_003977 [Taenia crassiceps]|uniref:Uncharacterized protein n=1 Tax=Taenia crassiceps TaxID=6207 RepID=A0ABR4QBC6_9CEST
MYTIVPSPLVELSETPSITDETMRQVSLEWSHYPTPSILEFLLSRKGGFDTKLARQRTTGREGGIDSLRKHFSHEHCDFQRTFDPRSNPPLVALRPAMTSEKLSSPRLEAKPPAIPPPEKCFTVRNK